MKPAALVATGVYVPPLSISNEELVAAFNRYVEERQQADPHAELAASSSEFIEKASGIRSRYVMNKSGILDPGLLQPVLAPRADEALSLQAEMCVSAATQALSKAGLAAKDIDVVIVACSNFQRAYPAISIEVQHALGMGGFAFDMNVACSSATFGLQAAVALIQSGVARRVLTLNPEICTGHLNFKDRDSHFIFGDAAAAMIFSEASLADQGFDIVSVRLKTEFSNHIRNNFGFLTRTEPEVIQNPEHFRDPDKLFKQNGRKVFKDVVPLVSDLLSAHLAGCHLQASQMKRFWLHQANANMNRLVLTKLLGREASEQEAPIILDRFGNTSSPGCVIALHETAGDLHSGEFGLLCSFGAGYSAGSVILRKR